MYLIANIIEHLDKEMPELSVVDEDYGQLEALFGAEKDTYPLTFPAVLVSVNSVDWSDTSEGHQIGPASIRVRLLFDCYDDMRSGSHTVHLARERTELCHRLWVALQNFRPNDNGWMTRISSRMIVADHGIKIYEDNYTVTTSERLPEKDTIARPAVRISAALDRGNH